MPKPQGKLLKNYAFRFKVLYLLIVLVVSAMVWFFYTRINYLDSFVNKVLTSKTEGSLSEHNSFTSTLTTEMKRLKVEDEEQIKRTKNTVKTKLLEVQSELNSIESGVHTDLGSSGTAKDLSQMTDSELKAFLSVKNAQRLNLDNLELDVRQYRNQEELGSVVRLYLRTKKPGANEPQPGSFVFVPTQLVSIDGNEEINISPELKREIVFSKVSEKYLMDILETTGEEALSAYFVSLGGFVRICKIFKDKENANIINHFKDVFSYKRSFADRTYFGLTLRKDYRESPPYVDISGEGIVKTYTVAIKNEKCKIVGIIGVDVRVKSIKEFFENTKLGSYGLFNRNFLIDFCSSVCKGNWKTKKGLLRAKELEKIKDYCKKNRNKLITEVNRFESEVRDAIIYTVPISKNELAFVLFDYDRLKTIRIISLVVIVLILLSVVWLIFYASVKHVKRIRAEENQHQILTQMHAAYVITDLKSEIIDYNEDFERLVGRGDIEGKQFSEFLTADSAKDLRFYLNRGDGRVECTLDLKGADGASVPVIYINTKAELQYDRKARLSILIESKSLESAVAEKYADRISHILKSPLHSILMIADNLRRKTAKPRYDEYYRILETEISGLKGEVSRLLRISRTEIKKLKPEFERVNLTRLVTVIRQEFAPVIQKKKLDFEANIAEGVYIEGDKNMIRASIENILENAEKYTLVGKISLRLMDSPGELRS